MKKTTKIILLIITVLITVTLYTADIMINGTPPLSHLLKVFSLVFFCLVCIYRLYSDT